MVQPTRSSRWLERVSRAVLASVAAVVLAGCVASERPAFTPPPDPPAKPWHDLDWADTLSGTIVPAGRLVAVTADSRRFVAVGSAPRGPVDDGIVLTSSDGIAWTTVSDPLFDGVTLLDVVASSPGFVAYGVASGDSARDAMSEAAIFVSADGLDWERVSLPPEPRPVYGGTLATDGRRLLAHGSTDGDDLPVWTSDDGTLWERATARHGVATLVAGPPGWIGGGSEGGADDSTATIYRSSDGLEWTRVDLPVDAGSAGRARAVVDLSVGAFGFIARGIASQGCGLGGSCPGFGVAWWSADGERWAMLPTETMPLAQVGAALAPIGDAGFLAVAGFGAWQSANGWSWSTLDAPPSDGRTNGAVASGDRVVAVGERWSESGAVSTWLASATWR